MNLCYNSKRVELYDPSQPRDESGKWTDGQSKEEKESVFHGTTENAVNKIKKNGIKANWGVMGLGVYATDERSAGNWAVTKWIQKNPSKKGIEKAKVAIIEVSKKLFPEYGMGDFLSPKDISPKDILSIKIKKLTDVEKENNEYKRKKYGSFSKKNNDFVYIAILLDGLKEKTEFYDPSQARDESGKWTSTGASSLREKLKQKISGQDHSKSEAVISGISKIAEGAKMATQYGASKASDVSKWLRSEKGQKFMSAVGESIKIGTKGAIQAIRQTHGDRYKILIGTLINPELGVFLAGRSALKGFVDGAIRQYQTNEGGRAVSNTIRRSVGISPMESTEERTNLQAEPSMDEIAEYLTDAISVSIKNEINGIKNFEVVTFYDPSQERDESGRWTSGGGVGGEIMVSPNISENMTYEEAKKMTGSPEHARAVSIAKDAIEKQKMKGKIESAVGDWEDGAENSIKIDVKGVKDFDQLAYTASKLGASLNQKAVVAFQKKKDGPDILHKITADKPMDQVRKILSDNGISFRTMVGDRAKTSVTILDKGSQLTANVAKFLGAINATSEAVRGVGEFIGGDTRIAGKKAYKSIIDNYERSFPNRVHLGLRGGRGSYHYRSYQTIEFYDPTQKRDDSGKWTSEGGASQGTTATPPWAKEDPERAKNETAQTTELYHGTSVDVLKSIREKGLKPSRSGVWGGGKVYSTDSLDLAMEYGCLRAKDRVKVGGKTLIGIVSVLSEGFKSVADNIPTVKAQKMGKTGMSAVSKIFTKDGSVDPKAIKKFQIFDVSEVRKYVYENGPKPKPVAVREMESNENIIYVPILIEQTEETSEDFEYASAIESKTFSYNGKKIEFYDPNQPRDERGRWSGSGAGKSGSAKKTSSKDRQSKESAKGDDLDTTIDRLSAEPKAREAIKKMNALRLKVAQAEGISYQDAQATMWSLRDKSRYVQHKDIQKTYDNPTPEHKRWRDQVIASELNPNAKSDNPIAVILMGSPASGKTTTGRPFAQKILGDRQTTKIDPDAIKAKSKGFEGWNAGAFHEESSIIAEKVILPMAIKERHNVLLDITGKNSDKVAKMAITLKSLGYTIGLVHVDVDDKVALARAEKRFNKPNGRWVPYKYIKGSAEKARNTWGKLTRDGIADIGYSIDGNAERVQGREAPVKETYGRIFE